MEGLTYYSLNTKIQKQTEMGAERPSRINPCILLIFPPNLGLTFVVENLSLGKETLGLPGKQTSVVL